MLSSLPRKSRENSNIGSPLDEHIVFPLVESTRFNLFKEYYSGNLHNDKLSIKYTLRFQPVALPKV